jgi:autotransporter-associated beta strand protein
VALSVSGTGTQILSGVNSYTGGTSVSAGLLKIAPTSSTTSALPTGALSISGSGEVQLESNVTAGSANPTPPPATSNVNITSLSITGSGVLDITNNHIIIDYTPGNDPISSIAAMIASGYAGDTWSGPGIISSLAASNPSYGVGYADSADPGNPAGLASGTIEIMYTLLGDANLDDKVNGADFTLMAANFNDSVTNGWDKGDFNYSGTVNGDDFVLLADNFNQFASQSSVASADLQALDSFAAANGISLASVPEPATMGLLTLGIAGVLARRRRV